MRIDALNRTWLSGCKTARDKEATLCVFHLSSSHSSSAGENTNGVREGGGLLHFFVYTTSLVTERRITSGFFSECNTHRSCEILTASPDLLRMTLSARQRIGGCPANGGSHVTAMILNKASNVHYNVTLKRDRATVVGVGKQ